jgi:5-formyltetrahydrofolate cyclo-ligase
MGQRRTRIPDDERARAAAAVAGRLAALPELRAATDGQAVLAGFVAIRRELDPEIALAQARARGGRLAWPRVDDGGSPRLRFHLAARAELRPGRFGIPEPDASSPEVPASEIAVVIVPGLAFDSTGHRLGFGGGYYDEVLHDEDGGSGRLATRPRFVIGVGYDFQVVDACPAGERDARVDCIVTDARVIRCPASPVAPGQADA